MNSTQVGITMLDTVAVTKQKINEGAPFDVVISNYLMAWALFGSRHPELIEQLHKEYLQSPDPTREGDSVGIIVALIEVIAELA